MDSHSGVGEDEAEEDDPRAFQVLDYIPRGNEVVTRNVSPGIRPRYPKIKDVGRIEGRSLRYQSAIIFRSSAHVKERTDEMLMMATAPVQIITHGAHDLADYSGTESRRLTLPCNSITTIPTVFIR